MLRRIKLALLALMAAALLSPAQARVGQWKVMGSKAISFLNQQATIRVGRHHGLVSKLQLRAFGKPVQLNRVIVVYGNGDEQDVRGRYTISSGGASPIINLEGNRRYISEVHIFYRAGSNRGFRRTLVEVYGMEAAARRPRVNLSGDWRPIGQEPLTTRDNRVTISIGKAAERVVLRVRDRALDITRLRIRFGNGQVQTVAIGDVFFDGDQTRAIDLNGGRRTIRNIVVDLRPRGRRRDARIEVLGFGRAPIVRPIPRGWKNVATQRVNLDNARFVLRVGRDKGLLTRIRLRSLDNAVRVRRIRIVFGNGSSQDVRLNERLNAGGETGTIDLDGNVRFIDRVVVQTVDQNRGRRSRLQIIGEVGRRAPVLRPIPRGWRSLVMNRVDLRDDRFVLSVGRGKGRIRRINLRSRDNAVYIRRIRIIFGNGSDQTVRVGRRLEAGEETGVVDLDGNQRFIREVVVRTRGQNRRRFTKLEMIGELGRVQRPIVRPGGRGWKELDAQNVSLRNNSFVMPVGRAEGVFTGIRLLTSDQPMDIGSLLITFANGETQTGHLNQRIHSGVPSPKILLRGGKRAIRQVIVRTTNRGGRRRTRLSLFGEYGRGGQGGGRPVGGGGNSGVRGDWISFGKQRANMFKPVLDTYAVGAGRGRFRKIRLRVLRHDVRIMAVRVNFANGEYQNIPIGGRIRDGAYSQAIDLASRRGRGRRVQSVQVRHKTKINFKGDGATEVWLMR